MRLVATAIATTTLLGGAKHDPLLMPAPASLRQACASIAARHTRWRVACPTRVPYTLIPSFATFGELSTHGYRSGYTIDCVGFSHTGHVHWDLDGGNPKVLVHLITAFDNTVARPRAVRLGTQPARVYAIDNVGDGPWVRRVAVYWVARGEAFTVTVYRIPGAVASVAAASRQALDVAMSVVRTGA